MKFFKFAICFITLISLLGVPGFPGASGQETEKKKQGPQTIPIYKPPLRGAPAGRVAGGTRGGEKAFPFLCLIVPEHIGLTMTSQPMLYFYISEPSAYPLEFTLIKDQEISPIIEDRVKSVTRPGIQGVNLADYDTRLETGVQYKWFVALVVDAQRRSKDILAAGGIEYVEPVESVEKRLAGVEKSEAGYVYAEAGLWYDAFHALSVEIEDAPGDRELRKQRAALLEQVGLGEVADREMGE